MSSMSSMSSMSFMAALICEGKHLDLPGRSFAYRTNLAAHTLLATLTTARTVRSP